MVSQNLDIAIVGAGPVGLCLGRALALQGWQVGVFEQQPLAALAEPAFDGREIALTHASQRLLQELGLWQRLPAGQVHPLRVARVMDRQLPRELRVQPDPGHDRLGNLVSNQLIRRAAWEQASATPGLELVGQCRIGAIRVGTGAVELDLGQAGQVQARLLVAADSRHSATRRALGIQADMFDYGKSMLVCRVEHEREHHHAAWEWFGLGQTLALLPLAEHQASAVVTLPGAEAQALAQMDPEACARELERRFGGRLGRMRLASSRHVYPLVATWARRFHGPRLALAGDAAVGMHPVTAHGFNLGLAGVERLATVLADARAQGRDPGAPALLERYGRRHQAGCRPLFQATRAVVGLYTDDRAPARLLRQAALGLCAGLPPFRQSLARMLTDAGPVDRGGPLARLRGVLAAS